MKKKIKTPVTFTEIEYLMFLSAVNSGYPVFPVDWNRRKRNAMYARRHRENKQESRDISSHIRLNQICQRETPSERPNHLA